ncbi:hypothetical protein lerEdw1_002943 [Lerista edwardsae]|nr:hypothetical protein lerEdw1_002943 [Lerista edwardsae]
MYALLWGFWLCQAVSAAKKTALGGKGSPVPQMECAFFSSFVGGALLVGLGWLVWKFVLKDWRKAHQAEPVVLASPDELESRLLHAFSQMEKELVKLVTCVRSYKASLVRRHRGCRGPKCQQIGENARAFNLVLYDIVKESDACPRPGAQCVGCSIRPALKALTQEEEELVSLLYRLHRLKRALVTGRLNRDRSPAAGDGLPHDLVIYKIQGQT